MPPWQFIQSVNGTHAANGTVPTSTITKAAAAAWDAGAATNQTLSGDGYVEFTVDATGKYRAIGLSDSGAPSVNFSTIDHCIYLKGGGTPTQYAVAELGVERITGTYAVGDVFRVQRVGTEVTYYINGAHVLTSAVAASGARQIDVAMFDTSLAAGIRLYDASSKSWPALTWTVTNCTANAAAGTFAPRRHTIVAPTKMRAGDQLVVVMGSLGQEFISATNVSWDFVNAFTTSTRKRGFAVYRRIVADSEPASYTFDRNVTQEAVIALLLYRGLDNAPAIIGGSVVDVAGSTAWAGPSRTLTRYSDLYLGFAYQSNLVGTMTAPTDCTARIDHTPGSAYGVFNSRMFVFEFYAEVLGATGTKSATSSLAASGQAGSVALQGAVPAGQGLSWSPLAPGAIGLPLEGI